MWTVCLIIAVAVFLITSLLAICCMFRKHNKILALDAIKWLFVGVAIASFMMFLPIYSNYLKENNGGLFETVFIALHYMFRLFIIDVEFEFIISNLAGLTVGLAKAYTAVMSVLVVLGPILTFGFVLSFFKNVTARFRYYFNFFSNAYVFSELNEKTLSLAQSLHEKEPKGKVLVFTDVFDGGDEKSYEMIKAAKEIGAICFKKDILAINFSRHSVKKDLRFFVISDDHVENVSQALSIVGKYETRENTRLYVLSAQPEAIIANEVRRLEGLKKNTSKASIIIRRINEVQSLITRNLYDKGYEAIFEKANEPVEENGEKLINAVVVGMGLHGTEMVKALSWFGQMDGYRLEINAFEKAENAKGKFTSLCPELMKFSGVYDIEGETRYTINVHGGIDVETYAFDEMLQKIGKPSYVFVSLGNDEINVAVAIKIRMLCKRMGCDPTIQAIVYNSEKKEALKGIVNFKGEEYNIDFIGDMKSSYSEAVILGTDLEYKALQRHLKFDPNGEDNFWQYSYNYRSSIASVIHSKMKRKCNVPGANKEPSERTKEELDTVRRLEHRRWNAYTRSEGYVYGGSIEKAVGRCDLAKKHNFLVPFDELPLSEQEKDDD